MKSESAHHETGPVKSHLIHHSTGCVSIHIGEDAGWSFPDGGFIFFSSSPENCRKIADAFIEAERVLREAQDLELASLNHAGEMLAWDSEREQMKI